MSDERERSRGYGAHDTRLALAHPVNKAARLVTRAKRASPVLGVHWHALKVVPWVDEQGQGERIGLGEC